MEPTSIPIRVLATCALAAIPSLAAAQDAGPPDHDARLIVTGSAGVVSDYRYRGLSRSDGDAAVHGQAFVELGGGVYAGVWGSSLGGDDQGAGDAEIDLIAGIDRDIASGLSLDIGATYFMFAGNGGPRLAQGLGDLGSYGEGNASLSYTLGPVQAKLGASYAPDQASIGGDNLYLYGQASAGIPATPLTLTAKWGRSKGSLAPGGDAYWDWSLGGDYVVGPVTLGAKYVDTDLPETGIKAIDRLGDASVVVSATIGF
ncbi:MAG: hypothetical protein GW859_03330 [Sphingomonadales bacterium]|nr:hypothetical protein [Sphingomonadales bacterium]